MRVFNDLVAAQTLGLQPAGAPPPQPGYTGRHLVLLREEAVARGTDILAAAQIRASSTKEFDDGIVTADALQDLDAVIFENLAVALVDAPAEAIASVQKAVPEPSPILAVEPERICQAIGTTEELSLEYLRGFRDAVRELAGKLVSERPPQSPSPPTFDESLATWGLQAIRADRTNATGSGTRIAVLDTGLFSGHPDFTGRNIRMQSFITGETPDDVFGHGTHCVGTACGPLQPQVGPRYGVASGVEIFAGKVLNNQGSGGDGGILAGIEWAVQNGCRVVSMSLGAPVSSGQVFSSVFEQAVRRAMGAGTLVVAAAGNDSDRPGRTDPVSHPANCPAILAVGAIDQRFQVAPFSNGGINPEGGEVDVAAPGVSVRSAWPAPLLYRTISGTSMATPHVAGVAALLAETTGAQGADLWKHIIESCRDIPLSSVDVGAGLVQAV